MLKENSSATDTIKVIKNPKITAGELKIKKMHPGLLGATSVSADIQLCLTKDLKLPSSLPDKKPFLTRTIIKKLACPWKYETKIAR